MDIRHLTHQSNDALCKCSLSKIILTKLAVGDPPWANALVGLSCNPLGTRYARNNGWMEGELLRLVIS